MAEAKQERDKKMNNSKIRLMFAALAACVALVTFTMHMQIGSAGHMFLREMFAFDWGPPHPKGGSWKNGRVFDEPRRTDTQDDHASSEKLDKLGVVWAKNSHKHSHDHNEEVRFVLRESNLGAPAFVGRNILDMNGENNVYGRKGRGHSILDLHGNLTMASKPLPTGLNSVAIGAAITTRRQLKLTADNMAAEIPFFRSLLTSFCLTGSSGYDYHFYVAHDHNDPFFHTFQHSHNVFEMVFYAVISKGCAKTFNVTLHLVECHHSGKPAWAQNDAMMAAYMDNAEYYYRVNDDTVMQTSGWTEKFIEELQRYTPPNVGVVGPWFKEGNFHILTHDFVHRTHIDIFGFYYPRVFTDWFADDWITGVYSPQRCRKVHGTKVKHTMEQGSRYVVHFEKVSKVRIEVEIGKAVMSRWLERHKAKQQHIAVDMSSTQLVVMSMPGNPDIDHLYGALRYAQLLPILMPNWRMRLYAMPVSNSTSRVMAIMLKKLAAIGVEIKMMDTSQNNLDPTLWPFQVVDDKVVERFLVRGTATRPTEREVLVVNEWLQSNKTFHCIRDHPMHASLALTPYLVGGQPSKLRRLFSQPWTKLIQGYKSAESFLNAVVWPVVKSSSMCHDSVSCWKWPSTAPFPVLRKENEYIGQTYDANDELIQAEDSRLWNVKYVSPQCVFIKDTGFKEQAVRSVIRARPVFWSQDYHVTPVMDMKSLLAPLGVKIIDKSLSHYCKSVHTCAQDLKVINRDNGMKLTPQLVEQFYYAYHNDSEMKQVSSFVCTLPLSMCEAFVPFNRSMLLIATIRYEQNHFERDEWRKFNNFLHRVQSDDRSVIAANNLYDAKYLEYFTGIKPLLLPNYCGYLKDSYKPKRQQFLVTPIHSSPLYDMFFSQVDSIIARKKLDLTLFPLREMYGQYLFGDLAAHPGIVYIPYQVSMVSLTEQYRMNIPLFFPSIDLLAKWHVQFKVVRQRTWAGFFRQISNGSNIEGVNAELPDPNNDLDEESVRYWLQFADYFQWPHIIHFDSVEDLVHKMLNVDLFEISRRMKMHNMKIRQGIKDTWSEVLIKLTRENGNI